MMAIEDYAVIGDGRSCALVAKTGSIDLLCWPRFDSDACLAALLGDERHGYWRVSPAGYASQTIRCYRDDTAILETEHVTDTGRVRVTDLMPWNDRGSSIIRIVEGLEGEVPMAMVLRLRFGYGQVTPWAQRCQRGLIFEVGPDRVVLDSSVELSLARRGRQRTLHGCQGRGSRFRSRLFVVDGASPVGAKDRIAGQVNADRMADMDPPVQSQRPVG